MKTKPTRYSSASDLSESQQCPRRQIPSQVIQDRVKRNNQQLTMIPSVPFAHNIKHLYLSHNQLQSLEGLENFPSLQSLNVSYNQLSQVEQLQRIVNPELMRSISVRMNHLKYGHEDYVVGLFSQLKKLQGQELASPESRKIIFIERKFIADNLIEFSKVASTIVQYMRSAGDKQNQKHPHNKQKGQREPQWMSSDLFNNLRDIYLHPTEDKLRHKKTSELVQLATKYIRTLLGTQVYALKQPSSTIDYCQRTRAMHQELCDEIMLRINKRNDKYLQTQLQDMGQNTIYDAFGRLGIFENLDNQNQVTMASGGLIIRDQKYPGKYIQKMDRQALKNHPMYLLANGLQPNTQSKSSNRIYTQGKQGQVLHNEENQPLYQRIPVFIWCREYLQVICEIVLSKVSAILSSHYDCIRYIDEIAQYDQEIELNLSNSDIMSFAPKEQSQGEPTGEMKMKQVRKDVKKTQKTPASLRAAPQNQIKFDETFVKTKTVLAQNYMFSLEKYSIYEINLVFKVFRGLKKRVKRRKRKQNQPTSHF